MRVVCVVSSVLPDRVHQEAVPGTVPQGYRLPGRRDGRLNVICRMVNEAQARLLRPVATLTGHGRPIWRAPGDDVAVPVGRVWHG